MSPFQKPQKASVVPNQVWNDSLCLGFLFFVKRLPLPHAKSIKKSLVFSGSRGCFSVQFIRNERHGDAMG